MQRHTALVLLTAGATAAVALLAPRLGAAQKTAPDPTAEPLATYRECEALKTRIAAQRKEIATIERRIAAQEAALRNYRAVKAQNDGTIARLEIKP